MRKRAIWVAAMSVIAAFALSAVMASAAGAAPAWKVNGTELSGSETVVATSTTSKVTVATLETTCNATIAMTISNSGGTAASSVESMTLSGCTTNAPACPVTATEAPNTPWSGAGLSAGGNPYLKISGFDNRITYGGSCAISGIKFRYIGSIGGLFDNANTTLTFDEASATATGSSIKSAGETKTTYSGVWNLQMTGANAGQKLTLS
jgi:hypothetical protein